LLSGLVNTFSANLLPNRLPVAKHIHSNPAPKQKVEALGVNLDAPWLAECEDTNQHKDDARKLSNLGEATF